MAEEKRLRHHKEYHDTDDMTEFEKYMAMKWGTPKGIATLLGTLAMFLLAIGVFLWLLHLANIIK